ncbi:hypothetical protein CYR55_18445 [Chimaeribacter californicus]|uniref:DUF3289 domain-containing protein n=1 Tax=Chimaeribacter californicus TaxID=2060067 RepID=A0A2N5DYC6_9GAMM|nr:PAAR domain-containing protein [Chimaeribacter californicus]PLR32567.1 hypothetical protein CYR55_18445 [Chimaeribacter californicus]
MARMLARLGNKTTQGYIVSATTSVYEGDLPLAQFGDLAWCNVCRGSFQMAATGTGWFEDGYFVANGDRVMCGCPNHTVCAESSFFDESADQGGFSSSFRETEPSTTHQTEPTQYAQTAKKPVSPPLPLPALIFETQKKMDDYTASDMKHGDLTAAQLREQYHLTDISSRCNPYQMADRQASARILFDEFRHLSDLYSFQGPYQGLMRKMIAHMQENSGKPFSDPLLDRAMKERIDEDTSESSSIKRIRNTLQKFISWEGKYYPLEKHSEFHASIIDSILPKFNNWADRINGLGITVHGTAATHIILKSLDINGDTFRATIHYQIQDHFGLDDVDVQHPLYHQFRLFRIWFMLQRWEYYDYKPFITEMNVTKTIEGHRDL